MASGIARLIFPAPPRSFPGRRGLKIALRALHVLCTGVLTGAYLFDPGTELRDPWLTAAIVSGFAILALDVHESGVFLLQVRGIVVAAKLVLLVALPWFARPSWVLVGLMLTSVVFSHAPSKVRYHVPFGGGRFIGARTKG